jgi:hypothetical protein
MSTAQQNKSKNTRQVFEGLTKRQQIKKQEKHPQLFEFEGQLFFLFFSFFLVLPLFLITLVVAFLFQNDVSALILLLAQKEVILIR